MPRAPPPEPNQILESFLRDQGILATKTNDKLATTEKIAINRLVIPA